MKTLLTLVISVVMVHSIVAQCNSTIPLTVVVISEPSPITPIPANGSTIWICQMVNNTEFVGNNNTYFIEDFSIVRITGNDNIVRVKFAVEIDGDNNEIYIENPDLINDLGYNNQTFVCPTGVTFNYTSIPPWGCSEVVGIADRTSLI
ncbi:MAG: hypothetical protein M3R08_03725, partial [Bacteroidota bacterium]|nr:hypothetical protein [Bacteroidota bacterium]